MTTSGLFLEETQALRGAWMRHDSEMLAEYLVQDVQDPRINLASVLTRHTLLRELFGPRLRPLMQHELRFAAAMNWLWQYRRSCPGPCDAAALLDALVERRTCAGSWEIPRVVHESFAILPCTVAGARIDNYIVRALLCHVNDCLRTPVAQEVLATFERLWSQVLTRLEAAPLTVFEPACGSANDYRFLVSFGIARFLQYTGQDLCEKNVFNARRLFPDAAFEVGNAMCLDAADQSFECTFVHDLIEHLSPAAMDRTLAELCRVTERTLLLGLFNMCHAREHTIVRCGPYYRNRLSAARLAEKLLDNGFGPCIVPIDRLVRERFGHMPWYTQTAYVVIARRLT